MKIPMITRCIIVCLMLPQAACYEAVPEKGPEPGPTTLTLADGTEPRLRVTAHWDRIAEGEYNLHEQYSEDFAYAPAERVREYASADFRAFLPGGTVAVGDVWRLDSMSLEPILRQFHPGATMHLRRGTPGAFACLRALSESYAEIAFRIHGEVELVANEVYMTLAQFTGHVLIDRGTQRVVRFFLEVPDRNTNADVNAYRYADIVYVPRMALVGGDASLHESIDWPDSISETEAAKRLARSFYRFEAIAWTDLETAIGRAQREHKPLHAVLLFGTLDDESC